MGESGRVSAILGSEAEPSGDGSNVEAALDPTAAALAAEAAKVDSELAKEAAAYFRKQSHLVGVQTEHLHEQREVNLSLLKLKRFAERLKLGLQLVLIVAAAIVVVGLIRIVWSGVNDHHLVIEAFSVPPDLAARGITGQVMAAQMLDKLGTINAQANSTREASSYAANWGEQVKLEIPDTGISIAELQRFFRDWLGHETHVSGEVIHESGELSLTARAGEAPGRTVKAAESDLSTLTQRAAEAAFAITQPYRYSVYLDTTGRQTQALEVARALTREGSAHERAWAWAQVSNLLMEMGDAAGAARAGEASIKLDPRIPVAYMNTSNGFYLLGDDEQSLIYMRKMLVALDSGAPDMSSEVRHQLRAAAQGSIDFPLGGFMEAEANLKLQEPGQLYGDAPDPDKLTNQDFVLNAEANDLALAHDVTGSLKIVGNHPMSDTDALSDIGYWDDAVVAGYERAIALDDWGGAAADMRDTIAAAPRWPAFAPIVIPLLLEPRLAYALARGGQQAEAETIAARLPKNCYRCMRARGWVATMAHDWPRADREFAEAVRQGPSLPAAYYDWGVSLLERGDLDSAIKKFATANERGPHFADPLEMWGEALLHQGKYQQAIDKFREAAQFAPRWGRLHLKWAESLDRAGRHAAAADEYRNAAGMDLSVADRALLAAQSRS
jgi:tetratricopeptide (TPR) repeat protein